MVTVRIAGGETDAEDEQSLPESVARSIRVRGVAEEFA
jgi:hypothetical protein